MPNQSEGEQAAREGLRQSVSKNRMQVELAQETISIVRHEVRAAIKDGMSDMMSQANMEKFWGVGVSMLQRQAAVKTGTFVGGVAMGILRKGLIFTILGGLVYAIGGWTALATLWKALIKFDT